MESGARKRLRAFAGPETWRDPAKGQAAPQVCLETPRPAVPSAKPEPSFSLETLFLQESRGKAGDVGHVHVAISVGIEKLCEDGVCLALRCCARRGCSRSSWGRAPGLQQADHCGKHNGKESENGVRIEAGLLLPTI